MAKDRFEPTVSGEYVVEYTGEQRFHAREKIKYDKKAGQWIGSKPAEFYAKYVTSWFEPGYGEHMYKRTDEQNNGCALDGNKPGMEEKNG